MTVFLLAVYDVHRCTAQRVTTYGCVLKRILKGACDGKQSVSKGHAGSHWLTLDYAVVLIGAVELWRTGVLPGKRTVLTCQENFTSG